MISLSHCFKMSVESLKSAKLRSSLTALGIIIGVAAVIATFALGTSFAGYLSEQLDTQGSNYILIFASKNNILHDEQIELIRNTGGIRGVATVNSQTAVITFANEQKNLSVMGTSEDLLEILNLPMYEGNFLTDKDTHVAVIGRRYAEEAFKKEISLQSTIQITLYNRDSQEYVTESFKIKGILGSEEMNIVTGGMENTMICIPSNIYENMTGQNDFQEIYAMSDSRESINATTEEVKRRLALNLGVSERDLNDTEKVPFTAINQAEILEQVGLVTATLQTFLLAIGGISLVVGAVGIMNIMIVTVTERTREIGILKAVGYTSQDVLLLFIMESIIISLIGGTIGTIVGLIGADLLVMRLGFPLSIPFSSIFLGIIVSIIVGIIAGAQPSYRASKMNPVDALRDL
jgi:ABC-type antimicrobial peptide transport system, permease component